MTLRDEVVIETDFDAREQLDVSASEASEYPKLSAADIRHNMIVLIMLDAIFTMGATDLPVVTNPLYVHLGASALVIGAISSLAIASQIGIFFSPFISVRFRFKKWYLLMSHVPYIGTWGVIGVVLLLSARLGLSNTQLLGLVVVMMIANNFFAGFVPLPHQEYTAACIPMSHRGRFTGFSQTVGSLAGIGSAALGGWILLHVAKPMAFGYLFLMIWFICQGGYLLALFGRERPTPIENAPKPWSREMIKAAWHDKPFVRLVMVNAMFLILFMPTFVTFVSVYGFRDLGMIPATAAAMAIVTQIVKITVSAPIGQLTDKLSPKRMLPFWAFVAAVALVPVLVLHNPLGVYISVGLSGIYMVGQQTAFLALVYGLPKPENRSGHYTLQILTSSLSYTAGPLLIGFMCDALSYRTTFAVVIMLALVLVPVTKWLLAPLSADARDYA